MKNKQIKKAITGGFAVGEAIRQVNPDVMAVYPITPQTPIVEYFAQEVADGNADTEIIPVESEHSAMSACIGAAAAGARTMTASSSQGIMYMLEMLPIASAMRLPIVMAVSTRAISGPLNIHGDHSDAMAMRDFGWIQLFAESVQESYDHLILGTKLAEKTLLPVAPNMDGFVTSHSVENVEIIADKVVKNFIGEYKPMQTLFDFKNPKTFGAIALSDSYFGFRKQVYDAMQEVEANFLKIAEEFKEISGRKYDLVEQYQTEDAEKVIVAMGATCGTVKATVDRLREKGEKVGLLKIRLFRPWPKKTVQQALKGAKEIFVLDKNLSFGSNQVLAGDVESILKRPVGSIVYGLGGREITEEEIENIFKGKVKNFLI